MAKHIPTKTTVFCPLEGNPLLLTHHLLPLAVPMDHCLFTHSLSGIKESLHLWDDCLDLGGSLSSWNRLAGLHRNSDSSYFLAPWSHQLSSNGSTRTPAVLQGHSSQSEAEAETLSDKGTRCSFNMDRGHTNTVGEQEKCILGFGVRGTRPGARQSPEPRVWLSQLSDTWQRPLPAKAWPVPNVHKKASSPRGQGFLWREVGHNCLSDILPNH